MRNKPILRVKYLGEVDGLIPNNADKLKAGKVYDVAEITEALGWYRIFVTPDTDYLYPPEFFEILK